ncbi:MAG: bacillithiol biosynthesis deacetylase BshB1 [Candidatus Aminicenantes bacterium]|nr:bacillithiol biosynthesis deacetylase BshB1 [Candidatus Aminicenantes bacterium]
MDLDALAFGAHADDVELGCGGTLIKLAELGHRTGIAVLTRGEMATRGSAEIRTGEFTSAAGIMGLAVHQMLDIPDGRVERTWENKLKIIGVLRAHRPKIVFAPYWVDRHPDHEEASCLVRQAAYLSGLKKIETGDPPFRPHKVIYYQTRFEFTPSFIVDISGVHERKMKAIRAYGSQFHRPGQAGPGSEETLIGRPEFLATIETRDRHSGAQIGVMFGEPFLVREALKLDDPVGFFGPEYLWTIP